jgi:hypothetical protein
VRTAIYSMGVSLDCDIAGRRALTTLTNRPFGRCRRPASSLSRRAGRLSISRGVLAGGAGCPLAPRNGGERPLGSIVGRRAERVVPVGRSPVSLIDLWSDAMMTTETRRRGSAAPLPPITS